MHPVFFVPNLSAEFEECGYEREMPFLSEEHMGELWWYDARMRLDNRAGGVKYRHNSGDSLASGESYESFGSMFSEAHTYMDQLQLEGKPRSYSYPHVMDIASQQNEANLKRHPHLYKTEPCRSFKETGRCRYEEKCQFAHGDAELRRIPKHPKHKSEYCRTFHATGICPYGVRCHFIHNETARQLVDMRRQVLCTPSTPSPATTRLQALITPTMTARSNALVEAGRSAASSPSPAVPREAPVMHVPVVPLQRFYSPVEQLNASFESEPESLSKEEAKVESVLVTMNCVAVPEVVDEEADVTSVHRLPIFQDISARPSEASPRRSSV